MTGTNVTVNAILSGPTLSEGVAAMLKAEPGHDSQSIEQIYAEFVRTHRPSSIIQRTATVEEVANLD